MSKVVYRVCDKCGGEIDTHGFCKIWKMARVTKVRLSYRTPDPYNYGDYYYELCDKCGKALNEYLNTRTERGEEGAENEN